MTTSPLILLIPSLRRFAAMLSANPCDAGRKRDSIVGSPQTLTTRLPASTLSLIIPSAITGVTKHSLVSARLSIEATVTDFITEAGISDRSILAETISSPKRRSRIKMAVLSESSPLTRSGKDRAETELHRTIPVKTRIRQRFLIFIRR